MAADLPHDILKLIRERIRYIEDYVRFGAVCKSWKSTASKEDCRGRALKEFPWLMLAEKEDSEKWCFHSSSSEKVFKMELPQIRGRKCWTTPCGWLVTFGIDMEMHLFNPFSKARISLPSQRTFTHQYPFYLSSLQFVFESPFVEKAIVSSSPDEPDCVVMAIYSQYSKIAFAKPGDCLWSPIATPRGVIRDIVCFKGDFFALNSNGVVLLCDLSGDEPIAKQFAASPITKSRDLMYLVAMGDDDLWLVISNLMSNDDDEDVTTTSAFDIYELDMNTRNWNRVFSIDGWSLVLGTNYSFSVKASDHCKPNCIYFVDDYCYYRLYEYSDGREMGIYHCKDRKVKPLLVSRDLKSVFSSPLWITPCLQ